MYITPDCIIKKELKHKKTDFIKYKIPFSELENIDIDEDYEKIKEYINKLNE